jgi:hypothetical protein
MAAKRLSENVASAIFADVEPRLPARRKKRGECDGPPHILSGNVLWIVSPGGKMPALYGRLDACHYFSDRL